MTHEEAIQIIRETYHTDEEMKALESLIPELRESEDERVAKAIDEIMKLSRTWGIAARYGFTAGDIRRWVKKQKEQKPAEWSEEDKDYYDTIVRKLEVIGDDSGLSSNQIKFLREHCPLSCSEWNEEDETIIEGACSALEIYGHTKLASRLKSLRPSWKPSEEQMNCLCAAVDAAIRKHNESVSGYEPARVLKSLYEDLKKL